MVLIYAKVETLTIHRESPYSLTEGVEAALLTTPSPCRAFELLALVSSPWGAGMESTITKISSTGPRSMTIIGTSGTNGRGSHFRKRISKSNIAFI
jgi:hypothetical protein